MPTNRTRRTINRRAATSDLDANLRKALSGGSGWFHPDYTTDELRKAWETHRDEVMEWYAAEYPGRRPFAWWIFEHGKERPINPAWPNDAAQTRAVYVKHGGFLHTGLCAGPEMVPFQQDETDYLREHGLLTPEELEIINADRT